MGTDRGTALLSDHDISGLAVAGAVAISPEAAARLQDIASAWAGRRSPYVDGLHSDTSARRRGRRPQHWMISPVVDLLVVYLALGGKPKPPGNGREERDAMQNCQFAFVRMFNSVLLERLQAGSAPAKLPGDFLVCELQRKRGAALSKLLRTALRHAAAPKPKQVVWRLPAANITLGAAALWSPPDSLRNIGGSMAQITRQFAPVAAAVAQQQAALGPGFLAVQRAVLAEAAGRPRIVVD